MKKRILKWLSAVLTILLLAGMMPPALMEDTALSPEGDDAQVISEPTDEIVEETSFELDDGEEAWMDSEDAGLTVEPEEAEYISNEADAPITLNRYYCVAAGTALWADPDGQEILGWLNPEAIVYGEDADGDVLRIWFDTLEARAAGEPLVSGYVAADSAEPLAEEDALLADAAMDDDAETRALNGASIPLATLDAIATPKSASDYAVVGLDVAAHSQAEIQAFVNAHPCNPEQSIAYSVAPSLSEPYSPGRLTPEMQQAIINYINQYRYIVGLNADVVFDASHEEQQAAGMESDSLPAVYALLNR